MALPPRRIARDRVVSSPLFAVRSLEDERQRAAFYLHALCELFARIGKRCYSVAVARAPRGTIPEEFCRVSVILNCLFVGLGGFVGSVLRYLVSLAPIRHESGFPLVTLGINVLGAFLLGLIMTAAGRGSVLD